MFTQGNEVSLGKADAQAIRQFQHIVDRITDEAAAGFDVGPDLMASILQLNQDGQSPQDFRDCGIIISGAVKKVYPKTTNQLRLVKALRYEAWIASVADVA